MNNYRKIVLLKIIKEYIKKKNNINNIKKEKDNKKRSRNKHEFLTMEEKKQIALKEGYMPLCVAKRHSKGQYLVKHYSTHINKKMHL